MLPKEILPVENESGDRESERLESMSASRKTPYIQKKISGQCRRKAIWILKLFMRKPAVRQIKRKNITKY